VLVRAYGDAPSSPAQAVLYGNGQTGLDDDNVFPLSAPGLQYVLKKERGQW
jgi:hypothetical protein